MSESRFKARSNMVLKIWGYQLIAREVSRGGMCSMARKWCGFLPQNQTIKKNWKLLEARQEEPAPEAETPLAEEEQKPSHNEEPTPPGEPVPIRTPKPN